MSILSLQVLPSLPLQAVSSWVLFDFSDFHKNKPANCLADDSWLQWFVGFYEGDGTFVFRGKGKGFMFSIAQDEKYILDQIKNTLGELAPEKS